MSDPLRERCAARAERRGDPMLGTAFPAARLLLVEQPFPWGPDGLRTSRFDTASAAAVEARCREQSVRVQAIRRLGRAPDDARRRWVLVDTRDATRSLRWGEFGDDAELLDLPLDGSAGAPDDAPLYLVCTHGKHDPCCGHLGHRLADALAALRPDRVWQASHLGGCRFAATVLTVPDGLMYGRVAPDDAGELVAAAEAGEVVSRLLRGRIGFPPAAQAATAYALEQLKLTRSADVALVSTTTVDADTVHVELATPAGAHRVTVARERIAATGLTCAAPQPGWFLAHRPYEIVETSITKR